MPLSKVCALADFSDPELGALIREMHPEAAVDSTYPIGREHRKAWEMAMAARALRALGATHYGAEILGVGAGEERTLFWLTRHARRVFATDLYLEPGEWAHTTGRSMLADPSGKLPQLRWNPRRLVVQHMDALDLQYEDACFDGVFSSGSIEHFGPYANVTRAAREMARVLRPGGVAAISTEFRIEGPPPGPPGTLLFNREELETLIVAAADWELVDPGALAVSGDLCDSAVAFEEASAGIDRFPHVALWLGDHVWTSVHLTLRKSS